MCSEFMIRASAAAFGSFAGFLFGWMLLLIKASFDRSAEKKRGEQVLFSTATMLKKCIDSDPDPDHVPHVTIDLLLSHYPALTDDVHMRKRCEQVFILYGEWKMGNFKSSIPAKERAISELTNIASAIRE
jgi:hypothetical protein